VTTAELGASDFAARLRLATASERFDIVQGLMAGDPDGKLVLVGGPESRIDLRDVRLPGAKLRGAVMAFADLHKADLSGATLSQADLRCAALEGADLRGADLTEVDLTDASLGEADLAGALLEDARMERASLRFANLTRAVLEGARLPGADFWGANLDGADLRQVVARGAILGEARAERADLREADLRDADLTNAKLAGAQLSRADLRGASMRGADLTGADLSGALLQGVDLSESRVAGAHWEGALLDRTRLTQDQIGRVGEETTKNPRSAARAYLALERNFDALGDSQADSWAYLMRRRMQKKAALGDARAAAAAGRPGAALAGLATFLGDNVVELMCNYGESLPRVFGSIVLVYVGFITIYGVVGGVDRITSLPGGGQSAHVTRSLLDLAVFSLGAMTTSGAESSALVAASPYVKLLSGIQALTGIFLTGLLGFVAGHRIRR
jgi:uncharacterized protein YjbI with pentapeptide repeats